MRNASTAAGRAARAGWTTRLMACGAAAASLGTLGSAAPSFAQDEGMTVTAPSRLVLPVASAPDPGPLRSLEIGLRRGASGGTDAGGTFTVDAGGLTGIAEVIWPQGCAHARDSAVATCDLRVSPSNPGNLMQLRVRSLVGAKAGATGVITYAPKTPAGAARPAKTLISVGSGPDVVIAAPSQLQVAKPGDTTGLPLSITNAGNEAAPGAIVRVYESSGLAWAATHSNCEYRTSPESGDFPASFLAFCVIDQPLAPGASYALADPLAFRTEGSALWERADLRVVSKSDDALAGVRGSGTWAKGSGTPLRLVDRPSVPPEELGDNYATTSLAVRNTADLAVTASVGSGKVGERVTANVTVTNRGPAAVTDITGGSPVVSVDIRIPAGTAVTGVPKACHPVRPNDEETAGPAGAPEYTCDTKNWLKVGASATFPFQLRIDKAMEPDGDGGGPATLQTDSDVNSRTSFDRNPANNTARIVVTGNGHQSSTAKLALAGGLAALFLGFLGAAFYVVRRRRHLRLR
ncbi:hypothetical protein [Streptomyces sp. PH10-H1]|uniref:hypothetical protein n=1 Tax=Streptomyces sp. PH10-H1 TaxID=3046212 RepID=UPI0024BAAFC9|nr:hypothetical protein [Streptomyces sp. PH10-H1]MDJ0342453.1 hypothetical protein [Streptomyces sp. PH10-H1]